MNQEREANQEPATAHMMLRWTRPASGLCEKPQSVPAIEEAASKLIAVALRREVLTIGYRFLRLGLIIMPAALVLPACNHIAARPFLADVILLSFSSEVRCIAFTQAGRCATVPLQSSRLARFCGELFSFSAIELAMNRRRKIVIVSDKMQRGYRYALTAPVGRNFDREFCPELTPREMLALGIFCGRYMTDCRGEFPPGRFVHAKLSPARKDCTLNYFGVSASQPLAVWRKKRWIHPDDPRGWFQRYCRYYMGRRMPEEDARQINRPLQKADRPAAFDPT